MTRGIAPAWDTNSADVGITLGICRDYNHATYGPWKLKYIKYHASATAAAALGTVLYWSDVDASVVTDDISAAVIASDPNAVAGVAVGALTAGQYGWMLVRGKTIVKTNGDDDITAGMTLIGSGDGTCDSVASGTASTYKPIGHALAADDDTADTVSALVCLE